MGRPIRVGTIKSPSTAQGYIAFWPCFQANTDTSVTDRSGKGNNGAFNSLTTGEAWTNANRLSNPTTSSHNVSLLKTAITAAGWKWNTARKDSLFVSVRARLTLPGSATSWMGNANSAGEGGIKWNVDNLGKWQIGFYDKLAASSEFSALTVVDASWGSNDHTIGLYLDGPNNTYTRFVDGVVLDGPTAFTTVQTLEPQSSSFDWNLGCSQTGQASNVVSQFSCFHILYAPQSAGSCQRPTHLAMRLHRSPALLVSGGTGMEWPY